MLQSLLGGPIAAYRDRSPDEVRDIYVSRFVDKQWQAGIAVSNDNWIIEGCPVNGPAIGAQGERVVVTWFTGAKDRASAKYAISTNGGKSFAEPVFISRHDVVGHMTLAFIDEHSFVIGWMESNRAGNYDILLQGFTFDGQAGEIQKVGKTNLMRAIPQLAKHGDELVMAWTDSFGDTTQVVSVRMALLGLYD